ncbi:hypothetical protein CTA1_12996 [Colletotrichum tanaceti]|uniref:Uncharacterized protein n=1 Tax=Colletotrichum tanaceti TaxID=1306861 RepID=A0A4U6X5H7_9PEZI|nr:hypothetical protein CTA1_12996 [Colletotrichum tanaceti]
MPSNSPACLIVRLDTVVVVVFIYSDDMTSAGIGTGLGPENCDALSAKVRDDRLLPVSASSVTTSGARERVKQGLASLQDSQPS